MPETKYIAEGTSLQAVANAIRTKTGGSGQLAFPGGFVDAIDDIQTGGVDVSPTTATEDKVLNGEIFFKANGSQATGNVVIQHYYTGSSEPSASLGVNGDIYLQTGG